MQGGVIGTKVFSQLHSPFLLIYPASIVPM